MIRLILFIVNVLTKTRLFALVNADQSFFFVSISSFAIAMK